MTPPEAEGRRPAVAIAGATGFVGRALCAELAVDHRVIGLTRGAPASAREGGVEWRWAGLSR